MTEQHGSAQPKAFTLIELLVVIAIISLLLSVLLPALRKAKAQGQQTVCNSNMVQIGRAAYLYAGDNQTFIPRGGQFGTWFKCFLPYVGQTADTDDYRNVKIYRCLSFPDKRQTVCYVVSSWTFNSKTDLTGHEITEPTKLSVFTHPMTTIYMAENENASWRPIIEDESHPDVQRLDIWNPGHLPASTGTDIGTGRRIAPNRHRAGCNYLFVDWHVEYIPTKDMSIRYWRDK
ncbi:MAG: prepilin-type N-terminal cleavage/methylation domain-containing protein [Planctomycetaceae bacterium]|nr:prepilin-type N-terminal cleavage/methylation domain-containing protein [Planctomycetaceae bacterium]